MADHNLYKEEFIVLVKNDYYDPQIVWTDEGHHFGTLEEASLKLEALIEEDDEIYNSIRQYRIIRRETYSRITEEDVDPIWSDEE